MGAFTPTEGLSPETEACQGCDGTASVAPGCLTHADAEPFKRLGCRPRRPREMWGAGPQDC
eukprot:434173-Pyramimonas_sp.AAC.1